MIECPECKGEGKVPVLYCECAGSGVGMSNETAASMAGAVHHYEPCIKCLGAGEIEEDEDDS